ncbi:MAG: hypothetical protein JEY97_01160 [Bacteroidales bacterium]|nr:hypothetical protein [Bacteroidales bacterium]
MKYKNRNFEIFIRLQHIEDYQGTRIEFASVNKAMKRMGSSIRVENEPISCASFCIKIPLKY